MLISHRRWWLALAATVLLVVGSVRAEDEGVEEEEKGKKAEPFVPAKFVEPKLSAEVADDVHLWEYFRGRGLIGKTWLKSKAKKDGVDAEISKYNGEWEIAQSSEVSIEGDYSLVVKTDARHHAIATKLTKDFTFGEKPLVLQYEVRFEEGQNCGGGYVKLLSKGAEEALDQFNDKTAYTIMFGPDKCSPNGKVHLIFRIRNPKNGTVSEHAAKQSESVSSSYWDDHKTHLYTLVVKPDGSYSVSVDYKSIFYGSMFKDLVPAIEPPKEIADPDDHKPVDWDDRAEIEDETATKPEDWDENAPKEIVDESAEKPSDWLDDEQPLIPDPAAVKPEDWEEEMDGEWEPPMIENEQCKGRSGCGEWKRPTKANPNYKGKWRRPKIANPAFKGVWTAKMIENPNWFAPEMAFEGLATVSALGIELWTMSKNILFDNILIASSETAASEAAKLTYDVRKSAEAVLSAHMGEDSGILKSIIAATEDKPWLWAVYALAVIIPLVIIAFCCFGQKSGPTSARDTAAYRKKHDDVAAADDEQEPVQEVEVGEEVEAEEEEVRQLEKGDEAPAPSSSRRKSSTSRSPSRTKKTARQMIEEDNSTDGEEAASVEEPIVEEAPKVPSAVKKRGRPKKAD